MMKNNDFLKKLNQYRFKEIEKIYLIKSTFFYDTIFLFSLIVIKSDQYIVFSPIEETDEIQIEIKDSFQLPKGSQVIAFDKYNGRKIGDIKKCLNHMGCFDQFSIAFDGFNTSFSIICELSLLGIFESKPVKWY